MATVKTKEALDRAEAQFRKRELAAREGEAVGPSTRRARAFDVKTARLKSLRLAKAAADEESAASAAASAAKEPAPARKRKPKRPEARSDAPRRYPTGRSRSRARRVRSGCARP